MLLAGYLWMFRLAFLMISDKNDVKNKIDINKLLRRPIMSKLFFGHDRGQEDCQSRF